VEPTPWRLHSKQILKAYPERRLSVHRDISHGSVNDSVNGALLSAICEVLFVEGWEAPCCVPGRFEIMDRYKKHTGEKARALGDIPVRQSSGRLTTKSNDEKQR